MTTEELRARLQARAAELRRQAEELKRRAEAEIGAMLTAAAELEQAAAYDEATASPVGDV